MLMNASWEWLDDSPVDFSNFNFNLSFSYNTSNDEENCAQIGTKNQDNSWTTVDCTDTTVCCVCNYQRPTTTESTASTTSALVTTSAITATTTDVTASTSATTSNNEQVSSTATKEPSLMPSVSPTSSPNSKSGSNSSILDGISSSIDLNETTTYFALLIIFLVTISCIINCCAFLHKRKNGTYDDVKYTSVIVFGLQVFDFYSDINFAAFLATISLNSSNNNSASNENERISYLVLFTMSVLFIVIPWLYNICFLFYMQKINWMDNVLTASWNRRHRKKLVFATMLSGGMFYSVRLLNSRLFGLRVLDMGLSHRQTLYIAQRTVIVTALLENLPQIVVQCIYLVRSGANFDIALTMALVSSSIAFTLAMISAIMNMLDDLHGMCFLWKCKIFIFVFEHWVVAYFCFVCFCFFVDCFGLLWTSPKTKQRLREG